MNKEFDLLVFIGRFQPLHNEHVRIIDTALEKAENVLVLIGSAGKPRTVRNPFTYSERKETLLEHYGFLSDLIVRPLFDKTYNESAWVKQVQDVVRSVALDIANRGNSYHTTGTSHMRIGLIGASKDHTSYYLKLFPQYESVDVPIQMTLNSTMIRKFYFETFDDTYKDCCNNRFVPEATQKLLDDYAESTPRKQLHKEYVFIREYKKSWEAAPYPVKHLTVDSVVEQSGHVLLVRRRAEPGKGLWALPGGHLDINETLENGALRELREETGIKVPEPVLRGSIVASRTFDDPHRSTIGRVVTQAYHIKLKDDVKLPKVKGADDADKAKWVPISDLKEEQFYDDHFHIISYFLGI